MSEKDDIEPNSNRCYEENENLGLDLNIAKNLSAEELHSLHDLLI